MTIRKIVKIDEEKCNGCGLCIPNCAEGALQIIDGKAKLVSEKYCDGLGACLGHCPLDAITIEEKEAEEFDEELVEAHLKKAQENNILDEENIETVDKFCSCPSSQPVVMSKGKDVEQSDRVKGISRLSTWPIQIMLVPPTAPYLQNADLLIAADCVPFAYADFHQDFLKDHAVVIGCPKLDDSNYYVKKLTEIFKNSGIKSVSIAHMEVPCCFGLKNIVSQALVDSKKTIPFKEYVVSINGELNAG